MMTHPQRGFKQAKGSRYHPRYQTRLRLATALKPILDQRLTQAAAAARLGLNQPKVPALRNTRLEGFSVVRLMTLLNALDQDIEIVIRAEPRSTSSF